MMEEANDLLKSSIAKQIEVAELSVKMRQDNYDRNKKSLGLLMNGNRNNMDIIERAEIYVSEAERAWRMAKEMLEEAYAQENKEARLGAMGNTEEKEMIAISNQTKAIMLFNNLAGNECEKSNCRFPDSTRNGNTIRN